MLRHHPFVAAFAIHAPAPITRISRVWIVTQPARIHVAVRCVRADDALAHQGWVNPGEGRRFAAMALYATGCGNRAFCSRRRFEVVTRKASDTHHATIVNRDLRVTFLTNARAKLG